MRANVIVLLAACTNPTDPCAIGDRSQPARLEILDAKLQVVTTDTTVPLIEPEDGGWVLLFGARATNIDGCDVTVTTSLRDTSNSEPLDVDRRPTQLEPADDRWGVTSNNHFALLPVCPTIGAPHDLDAVPYELTLELDDVNGQSVAQSVSVTPQCPDSICLCMCARGYVEGMTCD